MTTESQDLGLTSHPNVSSVSNLYIEMSKVKKSFSSVNLFGTAAKTSSPQKGAEFMLVNLETFHH